MYTNDTNKEVEGEKKCEGIFPLVLISILASGIIFALDLI